MGTESIKKKYGTLKRYAEIRGWNYQTLRATVCGSYDGPKGREIRARMRKDGVLDRLHNYPLSTLE